LKQDLGYSETLYNPCGMFSVATVDGQGGKVTIKSKVNPRKLPKIMILNVEEGTNVGFVSFRLGC
jgi:hypothetical protein